MSESLELIASSSAISPRCADALLASDHPSTAIPRVPEPNDLRRAASILQEHWRAVLLFAGITLASVTLVTFLMKPVYEPEGKLQIDSPGSETFSLDTSRVGTSDSEYISTEAEKLQSADLALATIRTLHLDQNPQLIGKSKTSAADIRSSTGLTEQERAALRYFQLNLSVQRNPGTRLVAVKFGSHDPQLSAAVVNATMTLFVERSYESQHEEIMRSSVWLAKQLDDIRDKMDDSSRQLAQYQHDHRIADIGGNSNTVAEQMANFNKQLADAQAERLQLQAYLSRDKKDDDSLPQVGANAVIQGLTQKHAEISAQLAQARVIYGASHPNVRQLENEANELKSQIAAQQATIVAELQTSYSAARAREYALQGEVARVTARLSHMEEYTNLQKEADADRQLYDNLYAKVKEAGIAAASKSSNIHIVDEAPVLDRPTRPHRIFNLLAALLFGLVGGIALAFVKEGMEDRLYTADDVRNWTGLQSIAVIPTISSNGGNWRRRRTILDDTNETLLPSRMLLDRPHAPESEALNALHTVLLLAQREAPRPVLVVTSPLPGEGKTTVATNLAVALAKRGKTCLVDADLRRPQAALALRVPSPDRGLVEALQGSAPLEEVIYPVPGVKDLSLLASWTFTQEAGDLITTSTMRPLIARLRELFEFVVIDTPPILPYADGRVLATLADGLLIVNRASVTPRTAMTRSLELLNEVRSAPILSVVLNAADFRCPDYRYYYAGYR
jgi:capsular exopolysaccharide synthesis family protein